MTVHYNKSDYRMRFMNPYKNIAPDEMKVEIRFDPLTGQTSRIFNLDYKPIEKPDFTKLAKETQGPKCPFCPESIEKTTTLYPDDVIPDGKVRIGEACLFPNLLPLDRYTGVCVMSKRHYIAIDEFTPEIIRDAFIAALTFVKKIAETDPNVRYFNINWNYMPPAGSSILHPHLQVNCGDIPTRQLMLQMEASQKYFLKNESTFWEDFAKAEMECGERYLGEIGSTFWTMSYAPQGALPDVLCVFRKHSSILQIENEDIDIFLKGLTNSIRYIKEEGLYSFNVSIFSGRESNHFRLNARISPRFLLREIGNSDQTYYQVLHREPCSMKSPESVRNRVLRLFNG